MSAILDKFITNVGDLVRKEARPAVVSALVTLQMMDLLKQGVWLPHKYTLLPPGEQNHAYLLHMPEDESWSLEAFVWRSGAMTPIHDHGVWGVVGQYIGSELDIRYMLLEGNVREDSGNLTETGRRPMMPGDVIALVPPDDIHQVKSIFIGTSVSIHVYGGNIREIDRNVFDLNTGKITIDKRR